MMLLLLLLAEIPSPQPAPLPLIAPYRLSALFPEQGALSEGLKIFYGTQAVGQLEALGAEEGCDGVRLSLMFRVLLQKDAGIFFRKGRLEVLPGEAPTSLSAGDEIQHLESPNTLPLQDPGCVEGSSEQSSGFGQLKPSVPSPRKDLREEEMFGAPASPPTSGSQPTPGSRSRLSDQAKEELELGGRLYLRHDVWWTEERDIEDQTLRSPHLLDLYLDARPKEALRLFSQLRMSLDPSQEEQIAPELDQLWLNLNLNDKAWLTAGVLPIRWGSGRVWNPSDLLNQERRDPLNFVDLRGGISAAKLQIPLESWGANFQILALTEGADRLGELGLALRFEWAQEATELSISLRGQGEQPLSLALDLSSGLGPLDLYGEGVLNYKENWRWQKGGYEPAHFWEAMAGDPQFSPELEEQEWSGQLLLGFEWPISYGAEQRLFLGMEYLFNDGGYEESDLYLWLYAQGEAQPLYLGRHYLALYLLLPQPGGWQDSQILFTAIQNLSDGSGLTRILWSQEIFQRLSLEPYLGVHFGDRAGELRFQAEPPSLGENEPLFELPPVIAQFGLWMRLEI